MAAQSVGPLIRRRTNTADQTNNTTTMASVTDLGVTLTSGVKYRAKVLLMWENSSVSTAAKFGCTGPTMTNIAGRLGHTTSATAFAMAALPTLATVITGTASVTTAGLLAEFEFLLQPSADGTFYPQFAANGGSTTITVKAGSYIEVQALY